MCSGLKGKYGREIRAVMTMQRNWEIERRIKAMFENVDYLHLITTKLPHAVEFGSVNIPQLAKGTKFEKLDFDYSGNLYIYIYIYYN